MDTTTTTNDFTSDPFLPEPARPQFLSVLCILTWILSGIMFLSTVYNLLNKPTPEEQQEQIEKVRESAPQAAESMELAYQNMDKPETMVSNLISLVSLVLSSLGAMMMWQLKRKGFFIYLIGELLPYVGLLMVGTAAFEAMATMLKMSAATMLGIAVGVLLLLDGVFIAMYAANLKHMK